MRVCEPIIATHSSKYTLSKNSVGTYMFPPDPTLPEDCSLPTKDSPP
jgi:hypothetical protein